MATRQRGSVTRGMAWMFLVLLLLFWLPGLGPLIAGIVGGKKAGGVGSALLAVCLPVLAAGLTLFVLGSHLSGVPVLGALVGLGATAVLLLHAGPLLLGAIVGGLLA